MAIFSWNARNVIETAVARFADESRREQWLAWSRAHPELLTSADPPARADEIVPRAVAEVAIAALDMKKAALKELLASLSEDDDYAPGVEMDISFVDSLLARLVDMARRGLA